MKKNKEGKSQKRKKKNLEKFLSAMFRINLDFLISILASKFSYIVFFSVFVTIEGQQRAPGRALGKLEVVKTERSAAKTSLDL